MKEKREQSELPFVMDYDPEFKKSSALIEVDGREPLQIEKDYLDGFVTWEEVLIEYEKLGIEV